MRRLLAPVIAAATLTATATPVLGLLLWTLTVTPSSAVAGTETTFTLTATNADLLTELGCLEVDLPTSFSILGASAGTASNGDSWEAVVFTNKVAVHSLSGGGRLGTLESITFTITAIPTAAGEWLWPNHAHAREDCAGTDELGTPLSILVVEPVTLLPSPTPTPAPTPTPTPAPTPTPILVLPTLPPLLVLPEPTAPLLSIRPSPTPTSAAADSTPGASSTTGPSPAATPRSTPSGASAGTGGGPSGTDGELAAGEAGTAALTVAGVEDAAAEPAEVSLGPLGVIDGLTVWAIPGAAVGGPGLLVILWVALQAGAAAAWIPAVRRLRGRDDGRRHPPAPAAF